MSNQENENQSPETPESPEGGTVEQTWAGPSQDDWQAFMDNQRALSEKVDSLFAEEEYEAPQVDLDGLDLSDPRQMAQLVGYVVDSRMEGISPYVRNAAQEQGKKRMHATFAELEKRVGKFDYDQAEKMATYFFEQTGDAEQAVIAAAQEAAEFAKRERAAAIAEYQERNSRPDRFNDPEATEGGMFREAPAKSYEEVMDRWAGQDEV